MAVFGAPLSLPDHAVAACEGALAAQRMLAKLNPRFERDYGCTLSMRIGINTGDMIVGNMGSERKRNYTVLGDAVNLASRLEAANKEFGTSILLGETTARRVQGKFATRPLTRLRVKGKTEAVEVHELVGAVGGLTAEQQSFLTAYNEGYAALTARRFAKAAAAFARAQILAPADLMTRAWQEEATAYTVDPPPPDWQPLLKLTSK
jgi:adenylate cyclase